jgi:hypothetical protein
LGFVVRQPAAVNAIILEPSASATRFDVWSAGWDTALRVHVSIEHK